MTLQQRLTDDALTYHGRGWCCIPIKLDDAKKKPTVKWKRYQTSRPAEQDLRSWLKRAGINGLAIITSVGLGPLVVRDFDQVPAYEQWRDAHPPLAAAL